MPCVMLSLMAADYAGDHLWLRAKRAQIRVKYHHHLELSTKPMLSLGGGRWRCGQRVRARVERPSIATGSATQEPHPSQPSRSARMRLSSRQGPEPGRSETVAKLIMS
jgi:hypothetical protein